MKTVLLAVLLLAACGGNREPSLRDHVRRFTHAAEDLALRCGQSNAAGTSIRLEVLLCRGRDCDAPPACEPAIDECLAEVAAMDCADRDYPSPCFDLWPGFACLGG